MPISISKRILRQPLTLVLTLVVIAVVTLLGPVEKTLGTNLRLVILHGSWVWAGKIAFALSAIFGLLWLVLRRLPYWHNLTRATAYTGLAFWLTYLPMSLLIMQMNWGGFFFDEPRWRIPFLFGVAAVLLQVGLWVFNTPLLTAIGNLVFGVALWWQLGGIENVLHPDSPVAQSTSNHIQVFFIILLILSLFTAAQITLWLYESLRDRQKTTA